MFAFTAYFRFLNFYYFWWSSAASTYFGSHEYIQVIKTGSEATDSVNYVHKSVL